MKRRHFPLSTKGEILEEGIDAKYFSKLDVSEGLWQMPLEKQLMFAHIHQPFWETVSSDCQLGCAWHLRHSTGKYNMLFVAIEVSKVYKDYVLVWGKRVEVHD